MEEWIAKEHALKSELHDLAVTGEQRELCKKDAAVSGAKTELGKSRTVHLTTSTTQDHSSPRKHGISFFLSLSLQQVPQRVEMLFRDPLDRALWLTPNSQTFQGALCTVPSAEVFL